MTKPVPFSLYDPHPVDKRLISRLMHIYECVYITIVIMRIIVILSIFVPWVLLKEALSEVSPGR